MEERRWLQFDRAVQFPYLIPRSNPYLLDAPHHAHTPMPSDSLALSLEPRQRTCVLALKQWSHLGFDLGMILVQPLLLVDRQERQVD